MSVSQETLESQNIQPVFSPKSHHTDSKSSFSCRRPFTSLPYLKNTPMTVLERVNSRSYLEVKELEEDKPVRGLEVKELEDNPQAKIKYDCGVEYIYDVNELEDDKPVGSKRLNSDDVYELTEPRIDHYLEIHEGGSLVRLKPTEINPLKSVTDHTTVEGEYVRGTRGVIKRFTHKSRNTLLQKLSSINQDKIPQNEVLFLTLTIDGRDTPRECKKYLNNFLTQLRQRYEGQRWSYCWKGEFQKRGILHFHIVFFGLKDMNHNWVRHTWSRITLGYKEYKRRCDLSDDKGEVFKKLVMTDLEQSRSWGRTERYFSKTLGYVSKNGQDEEELIEKFNEKDRVGRFWGIGRYEVFRSFVNRVCFNLTDEEYSVLRRVLINCVKSNRKRKYKGDFDWVGWKKHERYLKTGFKKFKYKKSTVLLNKLEPEIWLFMKNEVTSKLLKLLFPDKKEVFPILKKSISFREWVNTKEEPFPIGITV